MKALLPRQYNRQESQLLTIPNYIRWPENHIKHTNVHWTSKSPHITTLIQLFRHKHTKTRLIQCIGLCTALYNCLSVRLSYVTRWYCTDKTEPIIKQSTSNASPATLVLSHKNLSEIPNFDGDVKYVWSHAKLFYYPRDAS